MAQMLPSIQVTDINYTTRRDVSPTLQRQDTGRLSTKDAHGKLVSILRSPANSTTSSTNDVTQQGSAHTAYTEGKSPEAAIDPLSQQILQRTNASIAVQKVRTQGENASPQSPTFPKDVMDAKQGPELTRETSNVSAKPDKKKGVSFLSRFIPNKKKSTLDGFDDNGSDAGDARPEGMEAQAFRHTVDNMGFSPKYPQPPAYIKVRTKYKREKEFDRMFLAQELKSAAEKQTPAAGANPSRQSGSAATHNPIWATEFSKDGRYLAAGGQDRIVRVWAVISCPEERRGQEKAEADPLDDDGSRLSAPVFQQKPLREYQGHTSTILDLSWSKNSFLLSSSMDKTVRLWHISRGENLCTFKHTDFVPSIQFHPRDDRFFLAGSLDTKLRLWSIPDKSVAFWTQAPDMITAVSFTPDGKTCIAGTLNGMCMFYDTEGLKFQTQMHVKSTRGANAKGSKITGIQAMHWPPGNERGEVKLLISSNDSRIRLYNLRDKSLEIKFRGHENNSSQIRASFADDTGHIICGSEDRKAYIWSTSAPEGEKRNQRPVEMFEANSSITTCAVMAPLKTRHLLSASEDPIYDLCNPPPVTLISRAESVTSSRPPTESGTNSAAPTPAPTEANFKRAAETPAYIARSAHRDGNIIVTADYTGAIKVFRQDCAYSKRLRATAENWDASSVFSKRTGGSKMGRPSSIMSKASRATGRRRDSTSTQPPDDRIMSWRQDISHGSFDSMNGTGATPRRSYARSTSPRKNRISMSSSHRPATSTRDHSPAAPPSRAAEPFPSAPEEMPRPYTPKDSAPSLNQKPSRTGSPNSEKVTPLLRSATLLPQSANGAHPAPTGTPHFPAPRRARTDLQSLAGPTKSSGPSWAFFDKSAWKDPLSRSQGPRSSPRSPQTPQSQSHSLSQDTTRLGVLHSSPPDAERRGSLARSSLDSRLTSEMLADESEDEMRCGHCGGEEFKVRVVKAWAGDRGTGAMMTEERRLVCGRCGEVVDDDDDEEEAAARRRRRR